MCSFPLKKTNLLADDLFKSKIQKIYKVKQEWLALHALKPYIYYYKVNVKIMPLL